MNEVTTLKAMVMGYFIVTAAIAIFGIATIAGVVEEGADVKIVGWCMLFLAVLLAAFSKIVLAKFETLKVELTPPPPTKKKE